MKQSEIRTGRKVLLTKENSDWPGKPIKVHVIRIVRNYEDSVKIEALFQKEGKVREILIFCEDI